MGAIKYLKLNENYFEKIDSEDKAYFLGLLMADGCVYKNRILISLQEKDKYILEKFKTYIQYEGNLYKRNPRVKNHSIQYSLEFTSHKIAENLKSIGCVEKKSLILEFPIIDESLIPHFIRGIFDGDGHIMKEYRGKYINGRAGFVGSVPFMKSLRDKLKNSGFDIKKDYYCNNDKNIQIFFNSKNDILKLYQYLYTNSTIWLPRKRDIFEELIKLYNNKKFFYNNEPIFQYSKDNILIKEWNSLDKLVNETKTNRQCILRCIRGKHKTANKFIWSITKI